MEPMEAMQYGLGVDVTAAELVSVAPAYASYKAMLEAVNGAALSGYLIEYFDTVAGRPIRCDLSAAVVGDEDQTAREAVYLVSRLALGTVEAVRLEKIMDLVWTAGDVAIAADVGGRTGHKWAKSVSVTATGLLASRTGAAPVGASQLPAMVTILDIGPARGILRVLARGASTPADAVAPMHARWR